MGPGVDPHLYKASESDVRRLAEADLILYNGLHLEGKMGDILTKMARTPAGGRGHRGRSPRPSCASRRSSPASTTRTSGSTSRMWARTLEPIARELSALDPGARRRVRAPTPTPTRKELAELDAWVETRIADDPGRAAGAGHRPRRLRLLRPALRHRGGRPPGDQHPLRGRPPGRRAGRGARGRAPRVKAIFVESSVPRRSIEAVQAAAARRGHEVAIGGQLFSDALGAAGTPEGTYVGMVRAQRDDDRRGAASETR